MGTHTKRQVGVRVAGGGPQRAIQEPLRLEGLANQSLEFQFSGCAYMYCYDGLSHPGLANLCADHRFAAPQVMH